MKFVLIIAVLWLCLILGVSPGLANSATTVTDSRTAHFGVSEKLGLGHASPLPRGFRRTYVKEPSPRPADHLEFDGLSLRSQNHVVHKLQFDHSPWNWAHDTLCVVVGFQDHWTPSDYYAFMPNGYKAEPNQAVAFIATRKIVFTKHFDPQATQPMRSINHPSYTVYQLGRFIVLSQADQRRWFFETSPDDGVWRLHAIERIQQPKQRTVLHYQDNQVVRIEYPNGKFAKVLYKKNLPSQIDTPFGESIRFTRDDSGFIKNIEVYRQIKRRGKYKKLLLVKYQYQRDAEGRIVSFVAPYGQTYHAFYDVEEKQDQGLATMTYTTVLQRESDGLWIARRDHRNEVGNWTVKRLRGGRDQPISWSKPDSIHHIISQNKRWSTTAFQGKHDSRPTTVVPDKLGNPTSRLTPSGQMIRKTYNPMGLPDRITTVQGITSRRYNHFGQLIQQINPDRQATNFEYDEHARLINSVFANGDIARYLYDEKGLLQSSTINNETYQYKFDEWGRLTEMQYPDGLRYRWSFDKQGRCISQKRYIPKRDGTYREVLFTYQYDSDRLLETKYQDYRSSPITRRWVYDKNGRLSRLIHANKQTIIYRYNNNGWLIRIFDPKTTSHLYTYHNNGQLKKHETYKGQRRVDQNHYNERGRLIE